MNDGLAAKIQLEGFLDRKMMLIERLARQCPTLGDFHDLVTDRYAAFGGEVAALASETPSVERYERICHSMVDALMVSRGFQDTTVLFSPHLQTAFDLMCERPKTPQSGVPVTPESCLFSAKEAKRVVTAAIGVYRAFASLMTEIFSETTPLELQVRDNVALADIRALPGEQRPMAVLFVRSGTLWRFSNDVLMLLQPLLMRKAHLFDDWERQGRVIRKLPLKAFAARDEMRRLFNVARPAFEEAARRCNAHAIEPQLLNDGDKPQIPDAAASEGLKIGTAFPFVKYANRDKGEIQMTVVWDGVWQDHTFYITNTEQWKVIRQLVESDDVKVKIDKKTLDNTRSIHNLFRGGDGEDFYQYMKRNSRGRGTTWSLVQTPQDHSKE